MTTEPTGYEVARVEPAAVPVTISDVAALSPASPVDQVLRTLQRIEFAMSRARELKAAIEAEMVRWIQANGDIELGTIRYYVGTDRNTKSRDQRVTLEAMLEAKGGDLDGLAECLASGAFKPGACKLILGERFDELFETTEKPDLKTGKPARGLKKIDSRFLK